GRASEEEAFEVGIAAHVRSRPAAAVDAWTKAATGASRATSCRARLHLGVALLELGRHAEALETLDATLRGCSEAPDPALGDGVDREGSRSPRGGDCTLWRARGDGSPGDRGGLALRQG